MNYYKIAFWLKINIRPTKLNLMLLLFILSIFVQTIGAQTLPRPYAHYPLNVFEKYDLNRKDVSDIRTYDVSGNGRHGAVYMDGVEFPLMRGVKIDKFETDRTKDYKYYLNFDNHFGSSTDKILMPYVKKEDQTKNSSIHIPYPFENYDLSTPSNGNAFTITFWYKNSGLNYDRILDLPHILVVNSSDDLIIKYKSTGSSEESQKKKSDFFTSQSGWYFVAIRYNDANNDTLRTYTYFYEDGVNFDPNESVLNITKGHVTGLISRGTTASQIMDEEFDGSVRDVRFYRSSISESQINSIRVEDYNLSKGIFSPDQYVNTGVYSYYPFNSGSSDLNDQGIGGNNGTASGAVIPRPDRFEQLGKAIGLSTPTSHVSLNDFFPNYDEREGVTISFWTYISGSISRPKGVIPFNEETDDKHKFFYADNSTGKTMWGMQHIKGNLGQKKYLTTLSNTKEDWFDWFLEEASFNNREIGGTGKWYHVVLTSEKWQTQVYIGDMTSTMGCDQSPLYVNDWQGVPAAKQNFEIVKKIKECNAVLDFNWMQDLSSTSGLGTLTWGIGNKNGGTEKAASSIDQFRIYNWPMHPYEVKALHEIEKHNVAYLQEETPPVQTFAFISDYGCDGGTPSVPGNGVTPTNLNNPVEKVANMVKSWNPSFILTGGDNSYHDSANRGCSTSIDNNVGKYFRDYIYPYTSNHGYTRSSGVPNENLFFPALGNHDGNCTDGTPNNCLSIWTTYFPTEQYAPSSETGPNKGRYYTFTKGDIQFFVINSNGEEPDGNSSNSAQATWIRQQMQASTAAFKIVYMHHPPRYSKPIGQSGETNSIAMSQWQLKEWGADVVLAGDIHWYERINDNNLNYVTCGIGGFPGLSKLNQMATTGNVLSHQEGKYGALRIQEYADKVCFQFYSLDPADATNRSKDRVLDEFCLPKRTGGSSSLTQNVPTLASRNLDINTELIAVPNPTSGELTLRLQAQAEGNATVRILDLAGKQVYTQSIVLSKGAQEISLGNLKSQGIANGVYFLQVVSPQRNSTVKVVMQ